MHSDMVVKCLVAPGVIGTERTKSIVQRDIHRLPFDGHSLVSGNPVHGGLGYQVMKADVLVVPIACVPLVHDLSVLPLYHLDEVHRLNDWGVRTECLGRGIAVKAFVNDRLDGLCLLVPVVLLKLPD